MNQLGLCLVLAAAVAPASDLATILSNMDRAEAQFKGMTARVQMVKYTALVDDEAIEEGDMIARRNAGRDVDMKIHFDTPTVKDLLVRGMKLEIYRPKLALVEEYDLTNSREKVDQALMSGFGVSGSYLKSNYAITPAGNDNVEGQPAIKLDMVPKDAEMKKSVPKLEMWVSTETWQPVQQKLHQASGGDYQLYRYTEVDINPAVKDSAFKLKTIGKVKRVTPGR